MAEHDELVAEMPILETMGTQERQKLAKKRRLQQLKRWSQREKEWLAKEKQLNKRLANMINEENNGLNLKQYTSYNSNQRTKLRLGGNNHNNNNNNNNSSGSNHVGADSASSTCNTTECNPSTQVVVVTNGSAKKLVSPNGLNPNGRVQFNVGVMLLEAAARNDYDEVQRLLSLGVSPDSVNHDGLTALHQCCIDASEPIMRLLLEYGASVDARDTEQWTPLHAACTCGHLNLVKILVEHGADLLAVNGDCNMPFDICEDETTLDYIESQMLKQGITQEMIDLTRASTEMRMLDELERLVSTNQAKVLNEADEQGVTRLHIAATNNYLSVVKFLLNHNADANACDRDLWRPLHGVACWGNEQHMKVAELLVEAGADLDAKTLNDETVFDLCDNAELLDRLNRLKDELESEQQKGTGKLRRTQSRTNSRVHSVRRTSVRDKNQISRREAREEAMLRVDSNSEIQNTESAVTASSSDGVSVTEIVRSSDKNESDLLHNTDRVEQCNQNIKVTDLDEPNNGASQLALQTEERPVDRPVVSKNVKSNGTQPEDEKYDHLAQSTGCDQNVAQFTISNLNGHSQPLLDASRHKDGHFREHIDKNNSQNHSDVSNVHSGDLTHGSNNVANQRKRSTTTVQVHFTPTNYTLANLKKHRSDLRMRSSSLSGGSPSITSLNINGSEDVHKDNRELNPSSTPNNPSLLIRLDPGSNDLAIGGSLPTHISSNLIGINSPGSIFRKFHGEPSEVMGFEKTRRRRNKFCNII